ncbi:MAG: NnrS family protein [Novosphingobium sp.]|nr:NnrS family protein [Novosphingobium sp.]MBP6554335.1 NnrS family protein [Novosphingobium sp.]
MIKIIARQGAMRSTMTKPPLLLAAPHRLPFLTGSLGLGSTAAWWLFVLMQIHAGSTMAIAPAMPAALLHGPAMLFLGFTPFIFGFLLTVVPRWMGNSDLAWQHFGPVGVLLALGVTCAQIGLWSAQPLLLLGGLAILGGGWSLGLLLLAQLLLVNRRDGKPPCRHAASALSALALGLLALLCAIGFVITIDPRWLRWSNLLAINGFLLPVFLTVAHRMVPFFARMVVTDYQPWRPDWLLAAIWAMLSLRLLGEGFAQATTMALGSTGLALMTSMMAFKWWPQGPAPGLLNALLWGFLWAPAGFALSALDAGGVALGRAPLHALLIGFAGSMLVAMVTRVTQGHSGRPLAMFGLAWAAFAGIQLAAIMRIWAALQTEDSAILLLAAGAFLFGLTPWLARNALVYSRPRIDGRPG